MADVFNTIYQTGAASRHGGSAARLFAAQDAAVPELLASLKTLSAENKHLYDNLIKQVSDRRKAEDALRESRALLATERNRADDASRKAEADFAHVARLATMGELVASIGHELNQPLSIVVMSAETALKRLDDGDPADLRKVRVLVDHIVQQGVRAADMMRALRRLTKKSTPTLSEVSVDEMLREVLTLTNGESQTRGVAVATDLRAGDAMVFGDRIQLQQVMVNLIINAMDAMNGIDDRARTIKISSLIDNQRQVLLTIEDTGSGIDPANAEKIFDSFFTTKAEGMGLGLSICRSIVEGHGGRLQASPREPHGTVFSLLLPAVEQQAK